MSSNVWECVNNCWEGDCSKRVLRGGSRKGNPQNVRAANRFRNGSAFRVINYGSRLARTLP